MSLNITVIKDKILSENYFVLRNITYDPPVRTGTSFAINAKSTTGAMVQPSCCITVKSKAWC